MQFDPLYAPTGGPASRWDLDPVRGEVRYPAEWKRWLQLGDASELDSTRFWRSRVHPDDLLPMLGALTAYLEGWRSSYEARFRLLDGLGHYRPMLSRGETTERDATGRIVRLAGVLCDLSRAPAPPAPPRAAAPGGEHAQVLQAAPVGLLRVEHGLVRWANAAFCDLIGAPAAAFIGRPLTRLLPVPLDVGAGPLEVPLQRLDGGHRWVQFSLAHLPGRADVSVLACVDIGALKARHDEVEHLALHDALTGLPNRRLLQLRLEQALEIAGREGTRVALAYLDLDDFKGVNDRFGHAAGDRLLCMLGHRMRTAVRPQDTVARVGGDEFVVLLAGLQAEAEAEAVLGRLMTEVGVEVRLDGGGSVRAAVSAGLVFAPAGPACPVALMAAADAAMFAVKQAGGDRLAVQGSPR
jgi:diguanylate cyclase (GGDEF)-like protein